MNLPSLGRLVSRPLRDAWTHEALSFTPWLAANLDHLSEVLGIPLEIEGTEMRVDEFSADILARNPQDDSTVLIENQLAKTDHTHLGQLMTYLAGLNAKTVVWIAPEFREAHLSAIKWLNEHTVDPFTFFAVKLEVVQIGDSPLAPIFTVVEKPNAWDRRLQEVVREKESMSDRGEFRRAFWSAYLTRHPEAEALGIDQGAGSSKWLEVDPSENLIVSVWVGKSKVGIFLRGPRGSDGSDIAPRLEPHTEELAARLGIRIGRTTGLSFFSRELRIDMTDEANWPRAIDWLHETSQLYLATLRELVVEKA